MPRRRPCSPTPLRFTLPQDTGLAITPVAIFGAFELWPPSRGFTLPGQVVVRFLPDWAPAPSEDARTSLRRHMLRSLCKDVPACAGQPLTWGQVAEATANYAALAAVVRVIALLVGWYHRVLGLSAWRYGALAAAFEVFIYVKEMM